MFEQIILGSRIIKYILSKSYGHEKLTEFSLSSLHTNFHRLVVTLYFAQNLT